MEHSEHSQYVAQLKAEFDSCDTKSTGCLDRDELTALCRKLQIDTHLPLLLNSLLGDHAFARVNFEEFKKVFLAVLSHSLDSSLSEDDSSYLEPVVLEEEKPKFIRGTKRYGRRSRPDNQFDVTLGGDFKDPPPSRTEATDSSPASVRIAKLRRSTSLESVESLKSDEDPGSHKDNIELDFQPKETAHEDAQLAVVKGGCMYDHTCVDRLVKQENELLLRRLDGRSCLSEFQMFLCGSAPVSCSTPARGTDLQESQLLLEERLLRSTSPSLLTATVGQKVLSRLDDGSGCTSPDQVLALWTEEGIRNSRDILQTLDFSLEERLSLTDLTLALDNELLVSGNGIHQAALISYKNEIQHLQLVAEQACRERDKVKADLDLADQRNLQLVREVDDRHGSMETLNQSRIRDLEQDFRDRLAALRSQSEQENEALLQQAERERRTLQENLRLLRVQEAGLQEELCSATEENHRLEEELNVLKLKLAEAEGSVNKLQRDLDQILQHMMVGLDPSGTSPNPEEHLCDLLKEYEVQCRELQDRNDELTSELELLKSQRSDRKSGYSTGDEVSTTITWTEQRSSSESDSDESDMKRNEPLLVMNNPKSFDETPVCLLDGVTGQAVSIQTEMALEQLKQKHDQEVQQLKIQLETQVNYYERNMDLMKKNMEVERKDICSMFKLEISELEEQRAQAEQQVKQLKETLDQLQSHIQHGGWSYEQERRMQRERAELEQNFAKEISNLVQRLSSEKEDLEAELKLKMDQEVVLVRNEAEQRLSQMKLLHTEGQQRLLHQLYLERQQLQEQRGSWEKRLLQSEEERAGEEEARICSEFTSETKRLEKEHEVGQSEGCPAAFRQRCVQLEEDLKASGKRCSELEARLEEACAQLAESITILQDREAPTRDQTVYSLRLELDSLKTDRSRLIQDLKEQAMAVDNIQLELDGVRQELGNTRSTVEQLQETLEQEKSRTSQVQARLDEQKEEVNHLSQENWTYVRLADQLSTQIVELEEETVILKDHLRHLSSQFNESADLVPDLQRQLNSKTSEVDWLQDLLQQTKTSAEKQCCEVQQLRNQLEMKSKELDLTGGQVLQLQQALVYSQNQAKTAEQDLDREKSRMTQQLMELERLVLVLEDVMDPASLHRTQLEEVRSDNSILQERVRVLQKEVQNLEDDIAMKRMKLEKMEQEHERSRAEEERLHRENSSYREEILSLSNRNLQLSNNNGELSARLRGEQESVQMLRVRLESVSEQHEEGGATVKRLQEAAMQQERETQKQQDSWRQQRQQLEGELSSCKHELTRLSELKTELSTTTLKQLRLEEDKTKLLRDVTEQTKQVEKLQQSLLSLVAEAEVLRSELQAVSQERAGQAQEVTNLQRTLREAESKMEELDSDIRTITRERDNLLQALEEQEAQASGILQEETHKLRVENQELQHKLSDLHVQTLEAQNLIHGQQNLKTKLQELETARTRAEDQAVQADAALSLVQVQHERQLQELQQQVGGGSWQQVEQLQGWLQEEQRRRQQLEEALRLQAQQSDSQMSTKQEQYEKAMAALQQRMEELEIKLMGLRQVLQEKVEQLKTQMAKNTKISKLLKDLYTENSQLMTALQVTEQRQKTAEKKNLHLEEKIITLNTLLKEVVTVSLAT